MLDLDDGDQVLTLVGVAIAAFLVVAVAVLLLAAGAADRGGSPAPDAEWTLTRVNESHVRVVHDGGEPVRTETLVVTVDGRPRRVRWVAERLGPGDGGTVRVGGGRTVALLWDRAATRRETLERWQLSGTESETTPGAVRLERAG